ncbi:unnamed protein product [Peniophora sp. CBMAI 1063]|nr:unnamed protein product [Peniophora sp. CBMAI 1063]
MESSRTAFFALIIGIDKYECPDIPDLCGAVADAGDMDNYLRQNLAVPSSPIMNPLNERATRHHITACILSFAADERIQPGDPILIFDMEHKHPRPKSGESVARTVWFR